MPFIELAGLVANYAVAPLAAVCWYMFKRQDLRIDLLEKRANEMEKTLAKIETELHYISRDIKDIKTAVDRLFDKG